MISITTNCMNIAGESSSSSSSSPSSFDKYDDFDLSLLSDDNESKPMVQLKLERAGSVSPEYIPTTVFETSFLPQSVDSHIVSLTQERFHATYPPSPTPSVECNFMNGHNSHFGNHLFPPSPPDSSGAPSPVDCHFTWNSMSPSTVTNNSTDWNQMKPSNCETIPLNPINQQSAATPNDLMRKDFHSHSTIRECLQDSSFQKKYNLKPLESSSFDEDNLECLVLEHIPKFIRTTCDTLRISSDPQKWDREQVQVWLKFMLEQYVTSPVPNIEYIFNEDGEQLSQLNQMDFTDRLKDGATLFALLEIWKNTHLHANQINNYLDFTPWNMENEFELDDNEPKQNTNGSSSQEYIPMDTSSDVTFQICETANPANEQNSTTSNPKLDQNTVEQYAQQPMQSDSSKKNPTNPTAQTKTLHGRQGSAHIHLWQFLKELLEAPQKHGTAIRWIDRRSGIFKIEDSVRVARLWGQRKNRPAMNYDKLSRSIRQYYKKGIMQKTERSQRLVYQFCTPYICPVHTN